MPTHTTKKTGTSRSYQIAKPDPDAQKAIARMAAEEGKSIPQHIWHYYQIGLDAVALEEQLKRAEAETAMDREIQYRQFKMIARQFALTRMFVAAADIPGAEVEAAIAKADAAVELMFGSPADEPGDGEAE